MTTRRQERVNGRLVQEVSSAIRDLKDDRIGFVTVTEASVSPDLRNATVHVSILGPDPDAVMQVLIGSLPHLRKVVGRRLQLKYTPELHLRHDTRMEKAADMSRLIREARASDPNPDEGDGDGEEDA